MNLERSENAKLLAYLKVFRSDKPLYSSPGGHVDPYMGCGCHPDVVGRLWDQLGKSMSKDCRALVYHWPALVHPSSGVILGLCMGTQYALRIHGDMVEGARSAGLKSAMKWSSGEILDIGEKWGADWFWGAWKKEELSWMMG